jgi:two-component system phosphate regulon sensor histidine kinase PhoR
MSGKKNNPFIIFYILVCYVILQLFWWSYLMFNLNKEIYTLKSEIVKYQTEDKREIAIAEDELKQKLHSRIWMIFGEGSVFLILLSLGVLQIRKVLRKEAELARQQNNFIMSVSHELKSPIASAKLQLQTLLKHELSKEKQNEILQNALNDTERLNSLVENILLANSVENNAYLLNKESVNLKEYFSEIINTNAHLKSKNVFVTGEDNIKEAIDKIAFQSILLNLVENAVKYSFDGAIDIIINIKTENNQTVIAVSDKGVGIEDGEKENIFKKFYRTGDENTRKTKGTGLGLYLVKKFVEAHGATIKVKNNIPKGSIFEIKFNYN